MGDSAGTGGAGASGGGSSGASASNNPGSGGMSTPGGTSSGPGASGKSGGLGGTGTGTSGAAGTSGGLGSAGKGTGASAAGASASSSSSSAGKGPSSSGSAGGASAAGAKSGGGLSGGTSSGASVGNNPGSGGMSSPGGSSKSAGPGGGSVGASGVGGASNNSSGGSAGMGNNASGGGQGPGGVGSTPGASGKSGGASNNASGGGTNAAGARSSGAGPGASGLPGGAGTRGTAVGTSPGGTAADKSKSDPGVAGVPGGVSGRGMTSGGGLSGGTSMGGMNPGTPGALGGPGLGAGIGVGGGTVAGPSFGGSPMGAPAIGSGAKIGGGPFGMPGLSREGIGLSDPEDRGFPQNDPMDRFTGDIGPRMGYGTTPLGEGQAPTPSVPSDPRGPDIGMIGPTPSPNIAAPNVTPSNIAARAPSVRPGDPGVAGVPGGVIARGQQAPAPAGITGYGDTTVNDPGVMGAPRAVAARTAALKDPGFANEAYGPEAMRRAQNPATGNIAFRANNPGNLRPSSFTRDQPGYIGSIDTASGPFGVFSAPEYGSLAQTKLISGPAYLGGVRNTPIGIASRYSPSADPHNPPGQLAGYAHAIATGMGLNDINSPISNTPENVARLADVMARHEMGRPVAAGMTAGRLGVLGAPAGPAPSAPAAGFQGPAPAAPAPASRPNVTSGAAFPGMSVHAAPAPTGFGASSPSTPAFGGGIMGGNFPGGSLATSPAAASPTGSASGAVAAAASQAADVAAASGMDPNEAAARATAAAEAARSAALAAGATHQQAERAAIRAAQAEGASPATQKGQRGLSPGSLHTATHPSSTVATAPTPTGNIAMQAGTAPPGQFGVSPATPGLHPPNAKVAAATAPTPNMAISAGTNVPGNFGVSPGTTGLHAPNARVGAPTAPSASASTAMARAAEQQRAQAMDRARQQAQAQAHALAERLGMEPAAAPPPGGSFRNMAMTRANQPKGPAYSGSFPARGMQASNQPSNQSFSNVAMDAMNQPGPPTSAPAPAPFGPASTMMPSSMPTPRVKDQSQIAPSLSPYPAVPDFARPPAPAISPAMRDTTAPQPQAAPPAISPAMRDTMPAAPRMPGTSTIPMSEGPMSPTMATTPPVGEARTIFSPKIMSDLATNLQKFGPEFSQPKLSLAETFGQIPATVDKITQAVTGGWQVAMKNGDVMTTDPAKPGVASLTLKDGTVVSLDTKTGVSSATFGMPAGSVAEADLSRAIGNLVAGSEFSRDTALTSPAAPQGKQTPGIGAPAPPGAPQPGPGGPMPGTPQPPAASPGNLPLPMPDRPPSTPAPSVNPPASGAPTAPSPAQPGPSHFGPPTRPNLGGFPNVSMNPNMGTPGPQDRNQMGHNGIPPQMLAAMMAPQPQQLAAADPMAPPPDPHQQVMEVVAPMAIGAMVASMTQAPKAEGLSDPNVRRQMGMIA